MKKRYSFIVLLILFHASEVRSLIIGSLIAVSVESTVTFPQIDILTNNIIRAFAFMKNGFKLQNSSTVLEFQSAFPVSGVVDLRGGELTLDTDLIFKNITTLDGLGVIIGQGHMIQFSSSITNLPDDTESFDNTVLVFENNINFLSDITFSGDCVINGNENSINLANGSIHIDSDSTLIINNAKVIGIKNDKITFEDNTAALILDDVKWIQADSYTFDTGVITFQDFVTLSGTGTFFYEGTQTSTIQQDSQLIVDEDFELCLGNNSSLTNPPLGFYDNSSLLVLDNGKLSIKDEGVNFVTGTLQCKRIVTIDIASTSTLVFGISDSNYDFTLHLTPATTISIKNGSLSYKNVATDTLIFGDQLSLIQFLSGTTLNLFQSMNPGNGILSFEDNTTIAKATNKDILGSIHVLGDITYATL